MKMLLSLVLTFGMAIPTLAQGKINFINDSLHLVYWSPTFLLPGDAALAGRPYAVGDSGRIFTVELWAGTSSTSLALQSTADFTGQSALGKWNSKNVTLATIPAGPIFFLINIHDTADVYFGTSGIFMCNASGTIAYNSLCNHNSPASSTWTDGTYDLSGQVGLPGATGAIVLSTFPEPTVTALSGLAVALLLLRRCSETRRIKNEANPNQRG